MPIHDWTKVTAGTLHDFDVGWIAELRRSLNGGVLPAGYYSMAEQVASTIIPDVLTLQVMRGAAPRASSEPDDDMGGVAVAMVPPKMSVKDSVSESVLLATRRRHLVIRHTTGDRIVALIEIVSPGNKEKKTALNQFIEKAVGALDEGLHLLMIDLFPPGPLDPGGIHGTLWSRLGGDYAMPEGKPLTLAAYSAAGKGGMVNCCVEPTSVGSMLIDMPLFLTPERYVNIPLEQTYQAAYDGVPSRWKQVIEG
jgi:hypothetical protein